MNGVFLFRLRWMSGWNKGSVSTDVRPSVRPFTVRRSLPPRRRVTGGSVVTGIVIVIVIMFQQQFPLPSAIGRESQKTRGKRHAIDASFHPIETIDR